MAQDPKNKDGQPDSQDENEVKQWLNENDESGILANVIGKYKLFKHIASRFTETTLQAKFSDEQGHLVGPLIDKLEPFWNKRSGM